MVNRRVFLGLLGTSLVFVSACDSKNLQSSSAPNSTEVDIIIAAKRRLIMDALSISVTGTAAAESLRVVINQAEAHIDALLFYTTSTPSPEPKPDQTTLENRIITIEGLSSRCAVFSDNNLALASQVSNTELSRLLALIAGSEIQHSVLLSGFIA